MTDTFTDVVLDIAPNTTPARNAIPPDTLRAIDHLAETLANRHTDWRIAIRIDGKAVLTARPRTEQDH